MTDYLSITPDVKLGQNVKLSRFINLYGCEIGDETKIGAFVEIQKNASVGKRCKVSSRTGIFSRRMRCKTTSRTMRSGSVRVPSNARSMASVRLAVTRAITLRGDRTNRCSQGDPEMMTPAGIPGG